MVNYTNTVELRNIGEHLYKTGVNEKITVSCKREHGREGQVYSYKNKICVAREQHLRHSYTRLWPTKSGW
jgi:hypothetical protein